MGRLQKGVNDLKTWCLSNDSWGEQLMSEWAGEFDDKKNVDISDVTRASNKKAKWKCSKGHEWFAMIDQRTRDKTDCPYCVKEIHGEKVSKAKFSEINSLKTWCLSNGSFGEQLISEWTGEFDDKKNVDISDVARASNKKAKWKCYNGHEWFATINHRTSQKQGCPYCSGKRVSDTNNLKTWCLSNGDFGKQLILEWTGEVDGKKNVSIDKIAKASRKKAKWRCSKGHEWIVRIADRTNKKTGCPFCYNNARSEIIVKAKLSEENSLKTWCLSNRDFGKQLMSEWTGTVDNRQDVSIEDVSFGSAKKVKWRCSKGHEWFTAIVQRTRDKTGCPYCYDMASEENSLKAWCLSNDSFGKQLMSEWTGEVEDEKNVDIGNAARASNKKAKWICSKGHEWFATIAQRTYYKSGCPFCNTCGTSYPEQFIYHSLKQLFPNTESRCKVLKSPENPQGIEFDIGVPELKLCIEYSPTYWHQGREERDEYKKQICKQYGVRLIQIIEDSFNELDFMIEPDYICFKMNYNQRDEILETIVDHILKSLGHSISEIDIEKVKKDAYESSKGIEDEITDNN